MTKLMEQKIYQEIKGIKKELNIIRSFIFESEEDILADLRRGEKEYQAGETEDFETFLAREDPKLLKVFYAEIKNIRKIQKKSCKTA